MATDLCGGLRDIDPAQKSRNSAYLCGDCVPLCRSTLVFDLMFRVLTPDSIRGGIYPDVVLRQELLVGQLENCWEISASSVNHSIANTHVRGSLLLGKTSQAPRISFFRPHHTVKSFPKEVSCASDRDAWLFCFEQFWLGFFWYGNHPAAKRKYVRGDE